MSKKVNSKIDTEPVTPKSSYRGQKYQNLGSIADLSPLYTQTNHSISLFELGEEKHNLKSGRTEISNPNEDATKTFNRKENRLWTKGLNEDFEPERIEERMKHLWKYTIWKMKKWVTKKKK